MFHWLSDIRVILSAAAACSESSQLVLYGAAMPNTRWAWPPSSFFEEDAHAHLLCFQTDYLGAYLTCAQLIEARLRQP